MNAQPLPISDVPTRRATSRTNLARRAAGLLACAAMAACGSVPKKTFVFDAITTDEQPCPALIVVDDDWDAAAQNRQVVNEKGDDELELTLEFQRAQVEITVAPFDPNTGLLPRTRSEAIRNSMYKDDEPRRIRIDDPKRHLFVLQRKN